MKDKVFNFIKSNSVLKVLSLLLAFAIWFVIVSETNPLEQTSLNVTYKLEAEGEQVETKEGISLMNTDAVGARVEVVVKGRQESLSNVRSEDIRVSLDLSEVTSSGIQEVPVIVKSDKVGVNISEYSPKTISINFEKIVQATFPVTVKVEDEALQDGFVVAKTSVNPETIQLRGFESVISKISTVRVVVEAVNFDTQIDHTKSFRMICKYYDASGNEVTELDGVETVDVSITAGRVVALNKPALSGTPAEDCYVKEVNITPKNVIIIGPSTTLVDIVALDTTEIDIDGINEDITQIVDVVLPYGVSLADGSIRPTVTIKLGGIIEKQYSLNSENITMTGTSDGYVYTINSVSNMTLIGKDTTLNALDASKLKGRVSVGNLGVGSHEVLVSVQGLPSDLTYAEGGYVKARITVREAVVVTPEPTNPPEPSQTPEITPEVTPQILE